MKQVLSQEVAAVHPELLPIVAAAHMSDLEAAARRQRLLAGAPPRRQRALRRRAGWWMVGVGLKLATGRPVPHPS